MKIYLTYQELKDMNACEEALLSFRAIFGKKAIIKQVVHRLQNPGKKDKYAEDYEEWLSWLMSETLKLTIALLKAGADVHVCEDDALCYTAENGYTEIVKALLNAGADVHARGNHALCRAAEKGYTEIVKALLRAGADVHAREDYTLCCAAEYGHTEIVKILLNVGANVQARKDYALRCATANDHTEIVKILKAAMKKK